MLKVDATLLYWMVTLLEQMKVSCRLQAEIKVVKEGHRKEFLRHLEVARNYAEKLSLPLTQKQVDRLAKDIWESTGSYEDILAGLTDLTTRFSDELVLYHFPSEHQDLFEHAGKKMGDEVLARFPEARFDIEEGGKCLALGRGTACVFHLSRVVEVGLRYISREAQKYQIGCPDPSLTRSWDGWLNPIETELRKERKHKADDWNAVEPNYVTTLKLLRTLGAAWRHPTLQGQAKYTVEEAGEIFCTTLEFMRHTATARFS
jgi:hypothetical protein